MKRVLISVAAVGVLAATAFAQTREAPGRDISGRDMPGRDTLGRDMPGRDGLGRDMRGDAPWRRAMNPADREAFLDARVAALRAGLKLNPDQDKLWPPVEDAIRGLAKQRTEAREARRERWASMRRTQETADMPSQLRFMADRQAASADALRKLADASAPLYGSLDTAQRGRLAVLTRWMNPDRRGGMMRRGALDGAEPHFAEMDRSPRGR